MSRALALLRRHGSHCVEAQSDPRPEDRSRTESGCSVIQAQQHHSQRRHLARKKPVLGCLLFGWQQADGCVQFKHRHMPDQVVGPV